MISKFLRRSSQALQKDRSLPTAPSVSTSQGSVGTPGVGTLIDGRYRLDAEIGRGGMGIVYRAYDISNRRDVAIKVIDFDKANALTRGQFLKEAEINARLMHPHIVAIYEIGMIETCAQELSPYIVMEWVQGISLENLHGFTYARILDIGKQICDALEYAHRQGFAYRDLKPGNVLIEKRGFQYFVKLTDFGLARPRGIAYLPKESSLAGSFFYLAPELIAGQPAGVPSDLYALGVTLYEMITGHVRFSDFDEPTILSQHVDELVPPPSHSRSDVPSALDAIVLRLLTKNPKARFASAQEVYDTLTQLRVAQNNAMTRGNLSSVSIESAGRENGIAEVIQLLESNPLVTILDDDESLALAVCMQLAHQFSDGVWWVDLKTVSDPTLVLETVALTLDIVKSPHWSLTVSLIENLREKIQLLILDHCDQVLGTSAQFVETVLSTCPDVYILATTQQPLNISAEKLYRLVH